MTYAATPQPLGIMFGIPFVPFLGLGISKEDAETAARAAAAYYTYGASEVLLPIGKEVVSWIPGVPGSDINPYVNPSQQGLPPKQLCSYSTHAKFIENSCAYDRAHYPRENVWSGCWDKAQLKQWAIDAYAGTLQLPVCDRWIKQQLALAQKKREKARQARQVKNAVEQGKTAFTAYLGQKAYDQAIASQRAAEQGVVAYEQSQRAEQQEQTKNTLLVVGGLVLAVGGLAYWYKTRKVT